jgi:DNA-binding IscR family transcriptional regulator
MSPDQVTFAKIIRIIDGLSPTLCVSLHFYGKCDDCVSEEACSLRSVMEKWRDANLTVLEDTTLADLIK